MRGPCHLSMSKRTTFIYIDGLNLYYRAAKVHNIKWLNLLDLCKEKLSAHNDIVKIKYFTAMIGRSFNEGGNTRQQMYLRALRTIPNLEIILGRFKQEMDRRPLAANPSKLVEVLLVREKGSDVNLAVNMVNDAHKDLYNVAVVVSNDSDLMGAIKAVREAEKIVGVICPSPEITESLKKTANFDKILTKADLVKAEFPSMLQDGNGSFRRPREWD